MDVTIRRGRMRDVEEMGNMWRDMVREVNPNTNPNMEWWKEIMRINMTRDVRYRCVVAVCEDTVCGFIDFKFDLDPIASRIITVANHLYVRSEHRNRGVGWKLVNECVVESREEGSSGMVSTTHFPNMWKKHGFSTVGYVVGMKMDEWGIRKMEGKQDMTKDIEVK